MKKIINIASILLITAVQAFAQKEFKIAKNSGKLVINNISDLKVEGYDGKEIILSAAGTKEKIDDPRAAGLSVLGNSGFDNTGIGISVTEKDANTIVSAIAKEISLTVKLPQGVALSIKTTGIMRGDSTIIALSNIKSEIDASAQYENFSLKNVTGPISLKTLHGNIEGKLTPSFKGPISLVSVYGFVDVTVPENVKADISINTVFETLYAAKDLKLVVDESQPKEIAYGITGLNTKVEAINMQNITINGTTITTTTEPKVKGKGTISSTSAESVALPLAATAPTPPKPEKPATPKKHTTIVGDATYTY
ncbi:MAG: hypothetical protein EOO07_32345, partial [Chitinophagaceae bacterium]